MNKRMRGVEGEGRKGRGGADNERDRRTDIPYVRTVAQAWDRDKKKVNLCSSFFLALF